MLSFKPAFSLFSFILIKRLFSSLLSVTRVVSSSDLWMLIFLPAIFIPACASSSPTFLMMYSAYKLNNQGDNIQPWGTSFPIWNQSVVPCPFLTVASWRAYRFLRDFPGKNTAMGCPALLQGIFPTQGSNPGFLHCRWILYQLSHKGSTRILEWVAIPSPADLPDPGIELGSLALQVDSLLTELSGKPIHIQTFFFFFFFF